MAAWSWRTWPDVLIDFGREAYVAWRLAEGEVLHRDVVYVSGPLSPYWNALAFRLFGTGLDTLFAVNGAVLAAITATWLWLLARVADRTAAWAGGLVLLTLFAFAQYVGIGNYNYLAPYSHEMTHGLLLASLGFAAWSRALDRGASIWDAAAGFALGAVALTKIEILAAAAAAGAVGFLALARRANASELGRRLLFFGLGAAAPVASAAALLAGPLGLAGALEALAVGPLRLAGDDVASLLFYRRGLGSDDLPGNLGLALLWAAKILALFAPALAGSAALRGARARTRLAPAAAGVAMALAIAPFSDGIAWLQAPRALPVFLVAGLGIAVVPLLRRGGADAGDAAPILRAMLLAFATALLAKIFFNARIYQYGFALAMPGALLFTAALVCWIPAALSRRGANGALFRGAALGVLAIAIVAHLLAMAPHFESKSSRLGGVHDALRVHPGIARVLGGALEEVNARTRPGDTLTVLPEGAMLNFLTRRPLATRHFSFNPFEVHVYGEAAMIAALEASPPSAIVLIHHDTSEHGARYLGRNYGVELLRWVRDNYRTVRQIGDPPLEPGTRWGVQVLEPRPARGGRGLD